MFAPLLYIFHFNLPPSFYKSKSKRLPSQCRPKVKAFIIDTSICLILNALRKEEDLNEKTKAFKKSSP